MIFLTYDISGAFFDFFDLFRKIINWSFNFLRQIEFYQINLFSFIVSISLMSVIIPILFSIVRSEAVHNQYFRERVNKMRSRKKGD